MPINRFYTAIFFSQLYFFLKSAEVSFFTRTVLLQDSFCSVMRNCINSMTLLPVKYFGHDCKLRISVFFIWSYFLVFVLFLFLSSTLLSVSKYVIVFLVKY